MLILVLPAILYLPLSVTPAKSFIYRTLSIQQIVTGNYYSETFVTEFSRKSCELNAASYYLR